MSRAVPSADALRRRGVRLVWITIGWNLFEVFITIGLGIAAGSLALVAFGMDSVVEVFASLVVVWHSRDLLVMEESARTKRSLRLIALAFATLGVLLAVGAVIRLVQGTIPGESRLGIAYLALAAIVMLVLAVLKQRTGRSLGSEPLQAEAGVTYLDAALATSVLLSLLLNSLLGWWWADPIAALGIALIAMREGAEHWGEAAEADSPAG